MRRVLVAAMLAGCPTSQPPPSECTSDSECAPDLCARSGECLPASEVRMVRVTWTIRGMPASATACAQTPDFYIQFDGPTLQDTLGFVPVPCDSGLFTVDKLPKRYGQVEVGVDGRFNDVAYLDATGSAAFDLYP